jgi:hypothetical protein
MTPQDGATERIDFALCDDPGVHKFERLVETANPGEQRDDLQAAPPM